MYSIGCDLHRKRMQPCLIDDDPAHEGYPLPEQAILLEGEVPATREALAGGRQSIGKDQRGNLSLAHGSGSLRLDFPEAFRDDTTLNS